MDEQFNCNEQCKYQKDGKCTLERCDYLSPVHGAACTEHLWEDENNLHS